MKLVTCCILFLTLWLGAGAARAQTTCASPNPPACTFVAIDVATGLTVEAFCVGRGVRFEQCPGRNIPTSLLFYGVLQGVGTTYINAARQCEPPNQFPYTYVPPATDVGMVTVSELTNDGARSTYYIRTYQVKATPPPAFTVAPCPGGAALVTVTDATYDSYTVRVGAGAALPIVRNQATVVAAPAGASLTVTGTYAANGLCEGSATQVLAPLLPPQVPALTSLTLTGPLPGGAATLAVSQLPAGYFYSLQIADGSAPGGFRNVVSVPAGSTSISLPSPVAGCYRLFRTDACGGPTAASPVVCTLSLTGTSAQNRNQLLLNDAGSGATYTVTRNDQALSGLTIISGGLEDSNVECGTTYKYVVTATQLGGGIAVSNPDSILTQSTLPPAQPKLVASFNLNNVVELSPILVSGSLTKGSSLRYSRAAGANPPVDFGTVTSTRSQRDSTALGDLMARPPCYSVRLIDVCQNPSPESATVCPSLLSASPADPDGNTAALTWTPFSGPNPSASVTYALQRISAQGTVLGTVPLSSGTSFTDLTPPSDRQVLRYRLQISGAGLPAGMFSYSNLATVTRRLFLNIPTAFTPNGDGLNDVLEVKGKYLSNYTFVVVDRNGQEVFRGTQRSETWDGTIKGHAPVLGAYAWRFRQDGEDGKPFTATGSITILK